MRSTCQHAGGQDDHVGHPALGEVRQHEVGLEHGVGDVRGTDGLGMLQLEGHEVDGDDLTGASQMGTLQGPGADTATADDDDGLTRLHLGPVNGGAEASGDAAADQGGSPERRVGVDLHQRGLVDHHVVGEGAELRHAVELGVAQVMAPRHVAHHRAGQGVHAQVAQVLTSRGAPVAEATGRHECGSNVIAHRYRLDALADFDDDAGALGAPDARKERLDTEDRQDARVNADVTTAEVLIGVAHTGIGHLDRDFVGVRRVDLDLFGLPWLVQPGTDGCTNLHVVLPLGRHPRRRTREHPASR